MIVDECVDSAGGGACRSTVDDQPASDLSQLSGTTGALGFDADDEGRGERRDADPGSIGSTAL